MRCDLTRQPLRWLLVCAGLVSFTACGSSGPGGVAVDTLQTNVVFGAEQAAAPAPAPAAPTPAPLLAVQPLPTFALPPTVVFPNTPPLAITLPSLSLCPTAPPNSFPAEPATADVTRMPDVGAYRWVGAGTYDFSAGGVTIPFPLTPTFQTIVRNVQTFTDTFPQPGGSAQSLDYTFATVEPRLGSVNGYYQFLWQVKSNAAVGDPESGLVLTEVDTLNAQGGGSTAIFKAAPHNGLLVLPLPAAPGPVAPSAVSSTQGLPAPVSPPAGSTESVDTTGNGNNLQFSGNVGAPERVDVCGTWLQAWPVDGTLRNGTGTATVHMDVATQFGAVPVSLNIDGGFFGTTLHKATTHMAQVPPPAPLPSQWK